MNDAPEVITNRNIHRFTLTQVLDHVRSHLLAQGKRSIRTSGYSPRGTVCAYRSPDGLKCAVGCLIHDDDYSLNLEERSVDNISPEVFAYVNVNMRDLLHRLQSVHDLLDPCSWASELEKVKIDIDNGVYSS